MKKTVLTSFFAALYLVTFSQVTKISGKIGPYSIEMELEEGAELNTITGKYNYKGKTTYLTLQGDLHDDVLYLEESYKNNPTGEFYLLLDSDSLNGKWVKDTRSYDVHLVITNGEKACFDYFSVEDKSELVSGSINGTYEVEYYFLNDMWFEEGKPDIEIGYNGGSAVLEKITEDSLHFLVEAVCGPTYHIAFAEGIAVKHPEEQQSYIYTNEDGCEIIITLDVKEVSMSANAGMECGFGARAYLDHSFTKTSDEYSFDLGY